MNSVEVKHASTKREDELTPDCAKIESRRQEVKNLWLG